MWCDDDVPDDALDVYLSMFTSVNGEYVWWPDLFRYGNSYYYYYYYDIGVVAVDAVEKSELS